MQETGNLYTIFMGKHKRRENWEVSCTWNDNKSDIDEWVNDVTLD
jgi:hypothetical protein